jgi:outer membrane protein TolC
MLLMLEKEGFAYQKQGEMAKLEGKPMFGLGLNYMVFSPRPEMGVPGGMGGMDYMPAGMGNNMVMPMATVSLPIYRKKYKAMEAESKLYWEANERQKEDLQRNLETEFETILVSIKDADRKIRLLQDQIELTEQNAGALRYFIRNGRQFLRRDLEHPKRITGFQVESVEYED